MSMNTLNPKSKDALRENYRRSRRSQDHGSALRPKKIIDSFERQVARWEREDVEAEKDAALRARERMAQLAVHEQLYDMSPSQLESEADHLLADADLEEAMREEEAEWENYQFDREVLDGDEAEQDRFKRRGNPQLVETSKDDYDYPLEAQQEFVDHVRNERRSRGSKGHAGDPERFYQGHGTGIGSEYVEHLSDEDPVDNPLDGFSIKDRP